MVAVEAQAAGLRVIASDTVSPEVVVIPELVTFLSLAEGASAWTMHLCAAMRAPRFETAKANRAVSASPFAIEESYVALHSIYTSENNA